MTARKKMICLGETDKQEPRGKNIDSSALLLDIIMQGSDEGIAIIDPKGNIAKYNDRLGTILETSNEDIKETLLTRIFPGLKVTTPEIINYEYNSATKKLLVKVISGTAFFNDYKFLYISELNIINTQLTNQFEETRFLKDMYEKIINSIDEGIHSIDKDGNLFIYNSAQEKLEGYRASEVLGKHVTDIYNLNKTTSLLLKVMKEGRSIFDFHQEYTTKNGRYIDVLCSTVPLYSGDKIVGSAAILKDFSKFRQMAEKILDLQEKLGVKWSKTISIQQQDKRSTFDQLLGLNQQFTESVTWARTASKTDSPILIVGETGTGKELFAQSIHEESKRSQGPFLAINCAAIPESLLEGILFGTIKGAFTGAINRVGLLEQASGGSLFLDEINSMPLALQAKLLRVLEEKKVRRLGGNDEVSFDTRIISSCNVPPTTAIEHGQIRADLFYRLAVVYIFIPPLRDRIDDLELLASFFIQNLNKQLGKNIRGLHHDVIAAFKKYHWPGNIRQLKHTIECALNIIPTDQFFITPAYVPKYLGLFGNENADPEPEKLVEKSTYNNVFHQIKDQERDTIISAIKRSKGNVAKAAEELGMSRQLLQYHLKRFGLK